MSLLLAIFYWVVVPVFVFLIAKWLFRRVTTPFQKRAVVAVSVAVFLGLLWIAAGEKWWLDYQVRELCAKDGGVKVYETVTLPVEKFNQWGQPNFYRPDQGENALGSEYAMKWDVYYYRRGNPDSGTGGIVMARNHIQIIRRMDNRLLGETVLYGRRGGDLPGPWHPSSFSCPDSNDAGDIAMLKKIFVQSFGR